MGITHFRNTRKTALIKNTLQLPFLLTGFLVLQPCPAWPHEIGTTQVYVALHGNHTWSASITTAPTVLVNRLEAQAGQSLSANLTADAVHEKLTQFSQALADHVELRFDSIASPATISVGRVEMPTDIMLPAFVVVRAEGDIPAGAEAVTWRYGLVASTYAVVLADDTDGNRQTQWLDADARSDPFPIAANVRPPSTRDIVWQYLQLGFLHILPEGFDHMLFVLGIFLLNSKLRPILVQVTAFTIAHSVTLGLTMYGVISLSPRIVEPLIALSVSYIAIENITTSKLTPWRPIVVFCFGLLHGMGFAGALTELRLASGEILPALISFNLGIELAQLTIIGVALLAVALWFRGKRWYRSRVVIPASAAIAAIGLLWTVHGIFEW
ncbi:HupE/UreJ family protein [Sinorhizobium meliloti]|uniref:HupE/UreJ family protein n=1 Tax=Rhizobium meliloti TaxID=382 RepID=UPI0023806971|nr:HupE/UreJ family protein [Sinorhizobium meliloti]MDE3819717.1 HupE/UreJ family protein [Sinorhizobium meliloti]